MASKKGFIMYCDILRNIELLSMEQRGVLFTAILCDQSGEELPEMDTSVNIAFSFIKKGIDLNTTKYNAIVEKRRECGRLGGRPRKDENLTKPTESKKNQNKPNESNEKAKKPDNSKQISDNSKQISDNRDKHIVSVVRHQYGEYKNVLLSDEELEKLKEEAPEEYLNEIEQLSSYMASTGKHYKSHLATIRNWRRRKKEQKEVKINDSGDKGRTIEI